MLLELRVKNFALVDELALDLTGRLVVLTGETGAGKSILIDAIRFVLGERLDALRFQNTAGKPLWVEAVFEMEDPSLLANEWLTPYLDPQENLLILRREVSTEGKSRSFINQKTVNTSALKDAGNLLLDIHGQYDHQMLLEASTQRQILDRFARLESFLLQYRKPYETYVELTARRKEMESLRQGREREIDLLSYQVREIEKAELEEGEEETLRQEKVRLANAEKLYELAQRILESLDQSDASASSQISQSAKDLSALCRLDESMNSLGKDLEAAQLGLEEVIRSVRDYQESLSFEEGRLDEIETRLNQIKGLKKKYGSTVAEVLDFLQKSRTRLDLLVNSEQAGEDADRQIKQLMPELEKLAVRLTDERKRAGAALKKQIEAELKDLQMPNAAFDCSVVPLPDFGPHGKDAVEFLIRINLGQPMSPLRKAVSAGEISRVMLALKKVLAKVDSVPTLIFDEIDANIGGRLGTVTGEKLRGIALERQVLLITHLPQIASFADKHIKVSKQVRAGKTQAFYETLEGDARVKELSEMMSGKKDTDISKKHAEEMLAKAQR